MVKYKITFKLDIENALSGIDDDYNIDIEEIDDSCFDSVFDTSEKIKEFENWYEEILNIKEIEYTPEDEDAGALIVTMESILDDEKEFAKEIVYYLFESDWPKIKYHVTGTAYEDYWDYWRETHDQRSVDVDYSETESIIHYTDVNIEKLN